MPIKGFLMLFVLAVPVAFIYRKPISEWLDKIFDEENKEL